MLTKKQFYRQRMVFQIQMNKHVNTQHILKEQLLPSDYILNIHGKQ